MASTAIDWREVARIAVVRALPGLGDLLCAVPALRTLRRAAPHSEITLVGLDRAAWFVERFPHYVDELLVCPAWPGLAEIDGPVGAAGGFLADAHRRRFDLAVQMHGDGRASNPLTAALGAARWVGLARDGTASDDRRGTVSRYRLDRHEIDRCADALAPLGVPGDDGQLEFPVRAADERDADGLVPAGTTLAVVHPGASHPARRWSPIGFARIVEHLAPAVDVVVLTGGRAERRVTAAVTASLRPGLPVLDLAGRTPLGALAALLGRAAVVVANDTGTAHLAAAVGAPLVTVCGASDLVRWAPRSPTSRAVGASPPGRWPSAGAVRVAVDHLLAVAQGSRP